MSTIEDRLREKKLKVTKIRRAILGIFQQSDTPLAVDDIFEKLHAMHISANKTTVYRELELLSKEGFALEMDFGEGKKRYELNDKGHHHHLICKICRKVEHISIGSLERTISKAEESIDKTAQFKITGHVLEFFGLCSKCLKSISS